MITCRQLAELLLDYVNGELSPEMHAFVEQHLQWCPPCVTYLETYQVTIRLTRQLPCEPLPEDLQQRLRSALQSLDSEGRC